MGSRLIAGKMEEDSSGGGCRSWEEEMYWKHFQFTHFSQFLLPGYDHQLAMPKAFFGNQRKKLPERVTLKGPGGNTWEVGLAMNSGTMFFDEGWKEFVKDHSLKEHDLLVFKYNGVSHFEVMIFDGESFCERASSYFVKKCEQSKAPPENGSHPKRMLGGNSSGVIKATPVARFRGTSLEKTAENDIGSTVPSSRAGRAVVKNEAKTTPVAKPVTRTAEHPIVWEGTNAKFKRQKKSSGDSIHDSETEKSEGLSCSGDREKDKDVKTTPLSFDVVHDVPYISLRKLVTEAEKRKALESAQEAVTEDGFYVVMKPTHSVPNVWTNKHLPLLLKHGVVLKVKDKTWTTKFTYQQSRKSGGLSAGWKSFAVENNLEEFDVCVFEPDGPFYASISLNVKIVRVIQDE
ncbi:unnamed protein product [Linum tenue]|uniref:TF-B3 domain-containing protein n=2 Tax=Linum tenue TaxID=586396 RepID=A0AAV0RPV9_9ROSI|nr:unnamed protein product [Linum tenue]